MPVLRENLLYLTENHKKLSRIKTMKVNYDI